MISEEVIPMKHIYNKLIRDRIPEIIENDYKTCATRILNDEEYLKCLKSKLLEECHEVMNAEGEDIKKLQGYDNVLRLRVGTYRIIYTVDNGKLIITVIDAGNRGQIYKRL